MSNPIHVLHVDDDPSFGELLGEYLRYEDERFEVTTATSADEGLQHLADDSNPVRCLVSDFEMPHMNGLEFLKTVRQTHPDLPFILFTCKGPEEVARGAMSAGATEYLRKSGGSEQYTVLANLVRNAVD